MAISRNIWAVASTAGSGSGRIRRCPTPTGSATTSWRRCGHSPVRRHWMQRTTSTSRCRMPSGEASWCCSSKIDVRMRAIVPSSSSTLADSRDAASGLSGARDRLSRSKDRAVAKIRWTTWSCRSRAMRSRSACTCSRRSSSACRSCSGQSPWSQPFLTPNQPCSRTPSATNSVGPAGSNAGEPRSAVSCKIPDNGNAEALALDPRRDGRRVVGDVAPGGHGCAARGLARRVGAGRR